MPNKQNIEGKGFQPGKSGNPNGRPKGFKGLTETLKDILNEDGAMIVQNVLEIDAEGIETGKVFERAKIVIPKKDAIVLAAIKKSAKGEMRAIEFIFDRIEGKAIQPIHAAVSSSDGFYDMYQLAKEKENDTKSAKRSD